MSLRQRLRSALWRVPVAEEIREELAHHVELRTRELVDAGLDPEAARAEARRRFGNLDHVQRDLRALARRRDRRLNLRDRLSEIAQDLRFARRQCRLNPGVTAAAVVTLALGIGATTTIFSVAYAVVWQPFPFRDPDRVLVIEVASRSGPSRSSAGNFDYLRRHTTSLEYLAAASNASFNLTDAGVPERVVGMRATWEYLAAFGVSPLHGRLYTAEEDQPGREPVVVLSHRLWVRRFGGDPAIVGRDVRLNGLAHRVVGVLPASIDHISGNEQLWVPAAFTPERLLTFDGHFLSLVALRRQGVSIDQVNQDLERVMQGLRRDHPDFNRERTVRARVYGEYHTDTARDRLGILLAAVVLVLLIACGNVANLQLARLATRSRELAVRAAIGAGRGRIVRQILTESLVLAALGGAAGFVLAAWALPVLVANAPSFIRLETARLSGPVLVAGLAMIATSAVIVGWLPAWHATRRRDLRPDLGDHKGSGGAARPWARQAILTAQAALAVVVLTGAMLLVRSAAALGRVPIGFDPSGMLTARVGLTGPEYRSPDRARATFAELLSHLQAGPGVAAAALDSQPPLIGGGASNGLIPEGGGLTPEAAILSESHFVTPGYFTVIGLPLVAGRSFTTDDVRASPLVMIVNQTLAHRAFGSEDPIGKRITCCEDGPGRPSWKMVVGVVTDVRTRGPAGDIQPAFYLPVAQLPDEAWSWIQNTLTIVARPVSGDPAALAPVIRDAVRKIDASLPIFGIGTFDEGLRLILLQRRFNTWLMSLLGGSGLLLAAIGIYGVMAWSVSQRTVEIGVRMALGASLRDIVREIAGRGLKPVLIGLAVGIPGALGAGRLLHAQLFQVGAYDPWSLASVVVLLLLAASLAAVVPARRAAAIDPARALKS